jgi:hypothetical protein
MFTCQRSNFQHHSIIIVPVGIGWVPNTIKPSKMMTFTEFVVCKFAEFLCGGPGKKCRFHLVTKSWHPGTRFFFILKIFMIIIFSIYAHNYIYKHSLRLLFLQFIYIRHPQITRYHSENFTSSNIYYY